MVGSVLEKGPASRYFQRGKSGNSPSAPLSSGGSEGWLEPEEALQETSEVGPSAGIKSSSDNQEGHGWIHSGFHFLTPIKSPIPSLMIPEFHCLLPNGI